eukprot:10289786-Ditylum_brightwellii.AAC.1
MADGSDINCAHGNVNDDFGDDDLPISFFENEASKYDMDEDSDLSDDSNAFSDECGDAGHTILKNKSKSTQKQHTPNSEEIIAKKE